MNRPTHTLNPNTGREITINGVRFWKLLKHGFKYDKELNRVYDKPLPPGTTKYVPRPRGDKWVKMSKEESKVYDNDPDIKKIFVNDQDDDSNDSSSSEYVDIDEFEYDEDRYAIFSF